MGFGSKNDGGARSTLTQANSTIVEENLNLSHNDLAFMGPITRLPAANWWQPTSINSEFEMKDGFHDVSRIKAIPIGLNDGDNVGTYSRIGISTDNEILFKFREVMLAIPEMDVADCFAVTFKKEHTLIDVVTVLHRDVAIKRFGSPQLRRNGNDKDRGGRKNRRDRQNKDRQGKERDRRGNGKGSTGCGRSGKRSEWSWDRSEGRGSSAAEKPVRSVITGYSECRSEGGQGSTRWVVQAVGAIMMAGRGDRVKGAIGRKTKHSGSASDQKVEVEVSTVERVGSKRNNRIEIT